MASSNILTSLVPAVMILVPTAWVVWSIFRSRLWKPGLGVLLVTSIPVLMGTLLLCAMETDSETLYWSEDRLAYVKRYEGILLSEQREPYILPAGARAFLQQAYVTERQRKPDSSRRRFYTVTLYPIHLGTPAQSFELRALEDPTAAQAQVDAINAFLASGAPQLELYRRAERGVDGGLINGVVAYVAGLAVSALGGWGLRSNSETVVPRTELPKPSSRGRGRKARRTG